MSFAGTCQVATPRDSSSSPASRKQDNTVFLDSAFVPWTDQWAFLASVRKMSFFRPIRSGSVITPVACEDIRDGVDTPLASLFVHVARVMPEDADGAARARSATEAFLYRRLDTLTETSGRFRLNVALPIPFDGFGSLEVDLLCADARVVIELDGGQHLADPVAYRRDRRKDQLLQENGYFVLRFLAET